MFVHTDVKLIGLKGNFLKVVKNTPKWLKLIEDKFNHLLGQNDYFSIFFGGDLDHNWCRCFCQRSFVKVNGYGGYEKKPTIPVVG